jgi:hypothetical protein
LSSAAHHEEDEENDTQNEDDGDNDDDNNSPNGEPSAVGIVTARAINCFGGGARASIRFLELRGTVFVGARFRSVGGFRAVVTGQTCHQGCYVFIARVHNIISSHTELFSGIFRAIA